MGKQKASPKPGHEDGGRVSVKYLYEIAKIKQAVDPDLAEHDLEGICRMMLGTCKSMGVEVVEDTLAPPPIKIEV